MSDLSDPPKARLTLLSTFTPPSSSRAWLSAPHPSLPLLATASSDKSVRIYSLTTSTLHSTISGGHKRSIRSCAWKPGTKGESLLATGSFDASAGIWRRWDDGGLVPRPEPSEQDYTMKDEGDNDDEDEEWRFSVVLDGHESEVKSVAWSAGGQFLATCSRDKSVWIWEEMEDDNFETIAVLQEHEGDVKCVVWHPTEEMLASASYDDTIRLYREDLDDWACIAVLRGHESTVWAVDFEPHENSSLVARSGTTERQATHLAQCEASGPRLVSASDDQTIRTWRRIPKEKPSAPATGPGKIPSIIRTGSIEEDWVQETVLPKCHEQAIYSVAWSKQSGRIVSTGGDGKVVVYGEQWREGGEAHQVELGALDVFDGGAKQTGAGATEWIVLGEMDAAHGVFEVNHVCWAKRYDKGRTSDKEEMLVTTGDDGEVKAWTFS